MNRNIIRSRLRTARGFTLLELLVALLIIALLASYVGPKVLSYSDRAKVQAAQAQMKSLGDALVKYRLDTGSYPAADQGLEALVKQPSGTPMWHGPYLAKDVPNDPWGRPYQYHVPGRDSDAEIVSQGRDGKLGGEGYDADLVYGL
ncbi:type II secretion system major pseudopilin GspG [Burkholderia sp. IDO3]|uniref:type II secretion system major pseudopilin GspG n=1 Tax=Burkholderia sp. IDO3 TaxID=1705310 RepID=UPI000BBB0C33|nr:type II secretion system major pseudopilin GspG [Burkholderia sp. IDO3]AXK61781.1 type II secretion system protein GspG [Burkholderia sp. IDO3]PCD62971.1 type II secretion system protein GspG [Burkholderia sp. IDO3]